MVLQQFPNWHKFKVVSSGSQKNAFNKKTGIKNIYCVGFQFFFQLNPILFLIYESMKILLQDIIFFFYLRLYLTLIFDPYQFKHAMYSLLYQCAISLTLSHVLVMPVTNCKSVLCNTCIYTFIKTIHAIQELQVLFKGLGIH